MWLRSRKSPVTSIQHSPRQAPWFHSIYTLVLIVSAVIVSGGVINPVTLNIGVQVINATLLPVVPGFLFPVSVVAAFARGLSPERRLCLDGGHSDRLPSGPKIWLIAGIIDMRNSFNGLAAKVQRH